jgi:peptide/nickel transport system permease protein
VLIGATLVAFFVMRATGDPVNLLLPEGATEEVRQAMRVKLGLDQPIFTQYVKYLSNVVQGDFGYSIRHEIPVLDLILERMPATLELALAGMAITIILSFPLGIFIAIRRNTIWDLLGSSFSLLGQAMPTFWTGLMLILIVSVNLGWLPVSGRGTWQHLVLPAAVLGIYSTGRITRLVRSGMLEVLGKEYIRTARAKGLLERVVVWVHALRNASIPVVTLLGLEFASMLSGALIIEMVFAWPGLGRLVVTSVFSRDFPVVQGVVLTYAVLFIAANLVVDMVYSVLDPRIAY